jgi:hypothetical protein
MASTWTIKANERCFGPYTLEQMRLFVTEGRLAPHSLVAPVGDDRFKPAGEYDELAMLLRPATPAPAPQRPVFFTAEGDLGATYAVREQETTAQSRFLIIAEMKSRSITGLEQEIMRCGQAIAIMPQAWLLSSEMTINALRNTLVQRLGRIDMLFIVDATHNKAAWFNYGIENEARIRRIWQESQRPQPAETT